MGNLPQLLTLQINSECPKNPMNIDMWAGKRLCWRHPVLKLRCLAQCRAMCSVSNCTNMESAQGVSLKELNPRASWIATWFSAWQTLLNNLYKCSLCSSLRVLFRPWATISISGCNTTRPRLECEYYHRNFQKKNFLLSHLQYLHRRSTMLKYWKRTSTKKLWQYNFRNKRSNELPPLKDRHFLL